MREKPCKKDPIGFEPSVRLFPGGMNTKLISLGVFMVLRSAKLSDWVRLADCEGLLFASSSSSSASVRTHGRRGRCDLVTLSDSLL